MLTKVTNLNIPQIQTDAQIWKGFYLRKEGDRHDLFLYTSHS